MSDKNETSTSGSFASPYTGSDWGGVTTLFVTVATAVTTAAALSVGRIKLGPVGKILGAFKAFDSVRSIETGEDRTVHDPLVKVVIATEGITASDVTGMRFPLNEARLRKLVDSAGGAGWQTRNMIYAWYPDPKFLPLKTGRLLYRKGPHGIEILVHTSLLPK